MYTVIYGSLGNLINWSLISELGVFAKRPISKFTQFGPFVGDLTEREVMLTNSGMPIMVSCIGIHYSIWARHEKTCLQGFRSGMTETGLLSYTD